MDNSMKLVLLGAGPKTLAVAAKAAVLQNNGYRTPEIIVMEGNAVGSHWTGKNGYTNGNLLLGTSPEKDVGFPYASDCWSTVNSRINSEMLRFGWQQYLIQGGNYSEWIDRGRPPPTHREWGAYLHWVAGEAGLNLKLGKVYRIEIEDGKWSIFQKSDDRENKVENEKIQCDGLVITGPGSPVRVHQVPSAHWRVLDGRTFWAKDRPPFPPRSTVAIIGAGETAAAIAIGALQELDAGIKIISPNGGILFTRGENYLENAYFSNPDGPGKIDKSKLATDWSSFDETIRRELINRADRGVVSVHAQQVLNGTKAVTSLPGRVMKITASDEHVRLEIETNIAKGKASYEYFFDYVVVALGFNPLFFLEFAQGASFQNQVSELLGSKEWTNLDANKDLRKKAMECFESKIEPDMSVRGIAPKLHLPMLAGLHQGPGFPNLSCLGKLSDRILLPYCGQKKKSRLVSDR